MSNVVKGVIFDHSTIFPDISQTQVIDDIRLLLKNSKDAGLKIGVFSTNPLKLAPLLKQYSYPSVDLLLTKADVGVNKGSPKWIKEAASKLGTNTHQLLYIGDSKQDLLTALNIPTFYAHAKWNGVELPAKMTAFIAETPSQTWRFITHYLLIPPRWVHTLDDSDNELYLRSLVGASFNLPASSPATFNAKDIFTYGRDIRVGANSAKQILMNHALTSLYLEGLIEMGTKFVVYPSSKKGSVNPVSRDYIQPVSKVFHGYFLEDLLVRAKDAPDTSLERANGRIAPFSYQTDTVHLNPVYAGKIDGKSIIVFDDFTTTGQSLEWARNLLKSGGAGRVVLVTAGKFKHTHTLYSPVAADTIEPFVLKAYESSRFRSKTLRVNFIDKSENRLRESFEHIKDGLPLPVTTNQSQDLDWDALR
jgi:phosphoribosylpyrophosphate synthetase